MAIIANHYREEQETLAADPIVIAMEKGLPQGMDLRGHHEGLMQQALREYHKRGGQNAQSIGGVLEALRLIRHGAEARL